MCREIEYEVVPAALHNGVGLLPWSPLAGGFLSGKYARDGRLDEAGTRYGDGNAMFKYIGSSHVVNERNWATFDTVRHIADQIGATPSQVELSWVTNRPGVSSSIIGARTMEQLRANLAAVAIYLDTDMTGKLDSVSAPIHHEYPYGRFGLLQRHRYIDSSEQALREL